MTEPGDVLLDRVGLERAFTSLGERLVRRGVVSAPPSNPRHWRLAWLALPTMAANGGITSATTDMITAATIEYR